MGAQTEIYTGVCQHSRREDVLNYADRPIALRCRDCTTILGHYGACRGCGLTSALTAGSGRNERSFCEDSCFDRWRKRIAKERRSVSAKPRK